MHFAGFNWAAVLVSAAAFFAIGYIIHMRLVDLEAWNAAKRIDKAKLSATRMASGVVLPLATAIGLPCCSSGAMSRALATASHGASSLPWHRACSRPGWA